MSKSYYSRLKGSKESKQRRVSLSNCGCRLTTKCRVNRGENWEVCVYSYAERYRAGLNTERAAFELINRLPRHCSINVLLLGREIAIKSAAGVTTKVEMP